MTALRTPPRTLYRDSRCLESRSAYAAICVLILVKIDTDMPRSPKLVYPLLWSMTSHFAGVCKIPYFLMDTFSVTCVLCPCLAYFLMDTFSVTCVLCLCLSLSVSVSVSVSLCLSVSLSLSLSLSVSLSLSLSLSLSPSLPPSLTVSSSSLRVRQE